MKRPPAGGPQGIMIYALGTGIIGTVLVVYYSFWLLWIVPYGGFPGELEGVPAGMITGMGLYVILMGLLSLLAMVGYARNARWGWYAHLVAAVGMLAFPGALFEFKLDLHHLIAWAGWLFTLVMVIGMGIARRKKS